MIIFRTILLVGTVAMLAGCGKANDVARPRILAIAHVAFYVDDMAKAVDYYTDYLGYATPYSMPLSSGGELIWIKINDLQSVELFPGAAVAQGSDRLNHISIETDDADAMRLYLKSKGFEVPEKTPVGTSGNKNFSIFDPDGNKVEIVEHLPTGWTIRETGNFMPSNRISTRLQHVGIKVGHLDSALEFYEDILGFKEIYRQSSNGEVLSWVNMQVPDGDDYIEFMLYDEPPTIERLHTLHHICLEVDDIMAAHRELETRSLPTGCRSPTGMKLGKNGRWQINTFDPDGTRVEIMEPDTYNGEPIPVSDALPPVGRM